MKSYWIWNYGDYEIYHSNLVNARRQEFGMDYPAFWKYYDVDRNVILRRNIKAEKEGFVKLHLNGNGYIKINGKMYNKETKVTLLPGENEIEIYVVNLCGLPAAFVESDICPSDGNWYTLNAHREKIPAGFEKEYDAVSKNPEKFNFAYEKIIPVSREEKNGGILFDFGKEIFGFLILKNAKECEKIDVRYGESIYEALDTENSILFEKVTGDCQYKLRQRAFRYIFVRGSEEITAEAELEYLPLEQKGEFKCDNEDINKIWDMCAYTLKLTAREVLIEAVKRDRWLWGGDAYQAFKFCNYLFYDKDEVRRTIIALRGKEPFDEHINTITDYSLYWVISVYDYYLFYKDIDFIKFIYPRAQSLMNFCKSRENADGFITGKYNDWIFIDWSEMEKNGAISAEQMLYIAANNAMASLAKAIGAESKAYLDKAADLLKKVNEYYWDDKAGAFTESYENGKKSVTRHANIFAVIYGIATEAQKESIYKNVLCNDDITKITTPYFEGYELDAMAALGNFDYIEGMLKSYWKGMLDLGATTVWEEFNPALSEPEHYAMYGNKYGKSLCHAWGASPIYLLGRYYLGVYPTAPGYEKFEVKPYKGNLGYIQGKVCTGSGYVHVYLSDEKLSVKSTAPGGTLIWNDKKYTLNPDEEITINLK